MNLSINIQGTPQCTTCGEDTEVTNLSIYYGRTEVVVRCPRCGTQEILEYRLETGNRETAVV
jgi:predicted RNA-binding Zn-ribbon protein involved in translation (DUF1610 family)